MLDGSHNTPDNCSNLTPVERAVERRRVFFRFHKHFARSDVSHADKHRKAEVRNRSIAQQVEIRSERHTVNPNKKKWGRTWHSLPGIINGEKLLRGIHWILHARALLASLGNQISSEDVKKASSIPCVVIKTGPAKTEGPHDSGYSLVVTHTSTNPSDRAYGDHSVADGGFSFKKINVA